MLSTALIVLLVAASGSAAPAASSSDYPTAVAPARDVLSWNQSQNGKVNLQVSLKDVQIFALLKSDLYDDDDNNNNADYDYEDLINLLNTTVALNPQKPEGEETSSEESSVTEEQPLLTISEVLEADAATAAPKDKNGTLLLPASPLLPFASNGKPENISQLPNDPAKRSGMRPELYQRDRPASSTPKPPCQQGYTRDRLGRCRRLKSTPKRRRPTSLSFPLKLSLQGLAKGFRLARLPSDDDWE